VVMERMCLTTNSSAARPRRPWHPAHPRWARAVAELGTPAAVVQDIGRGKAKNIKRGHSAVSILVARDVRNSIGEKNIKRGHNEAHVTHSAGARRPSPSDAAPTRMTATPRSMCLAMTSASWSRASSPATAITGRQSVRVGRGREILARRSVRVGRGRGASCTGQRASTASTTSAASAVWIAESSRGCLRWQHLQPREWSL
jgi:hypothetical protein